MSRADETAKTVNRSRIVAMAMVMVLDDVVVIEEEEPTGDVLGER